MVQKLFLKIVLSTQIIDAFHVSLILKNVSICLLKTHYTNAKGHDHCVALHTVYSMWQREAALVIIQFWNKPKLLGITAREGATTEAQNIEMNMYTVDFCQYNVAHMANTVLFLLKIYRVVLL